MKKLAVFLLTGLTCASMLFGCGSKNDTVETVPVAEVQESTAAPAETESEPAFFHLGYQPGPTWYGKGRSGILFPYTG